MWAVRIVGTFIATSFFGGGLVAAWGFMILHNLCLFVVYLILILNGRWNPLRKYSEQGEEEKAYAH
jgi:Na+-driven multidrug efflux pump